MAGAGFAIFIDFVARDASPCHAHNICTAASGFGGVRQIYVRGGGGAAAQAATRAQCARVCPVNR